MRHFSFKGSTVRIFPGKDICDPPHDKIWVTLGGDSIHCVEWKDSIEFSKWLHKVAKNIEDSFWRKVSDTKTSCKELGVEKDCPGCIGCR